MHSTSKESNGAPPVSQLLSEKRSIHFASFSAMFYTVVWIMNYYSKITSVIKVANAKDTDDFQGSHHVLPPRNQHFTVSKDEWNTKVDTMKNALCILQYAKRHLSG